MSQKNILFVHLGPSSFVREDLRILNGVHNVNEFHFSPAKSEFILFTAIQYMIRFTRQFFWLLKHISSADLIYGWFADYHTFLPALFSRVIKKPLVIVNGGFDAVSNTELGYGIYCSKWRRPLGTYVLKHCSLLLPVDKTLIESDQTSKNWGEAYPNGIRYHIPDLKTPWKEVPTGYDPAIWPAGPGIREREVLTVAYIGTLRTAKIKGIDLFIKCAGLLPGFTFRIVGVPEKIQAVLAETYVLPSNLRLYPPVEREELSAFYQRASVYAQLSRSEGLPNVLCEAMLSGCIPVGSPVYGIPHAIGDTGFIAEEPSAELISELIRKAFDQNEELRVKARNRIVKHYSLEKRTHTLLNLVSEVTGN